MAVSTSYLDALDELLVDVPGLGVKFTGTATASGADVTTVDPSVNRATAAQLRNKFLYIPDAANTEDVTHSASHSSISGATLTITTRGNYTGNESGSMYLLAVHPDILMKLVNEALRDGTLTQRVIIPLGTGPSDYNNLASNAAAYTGTSATLSKDTSEVIEGPRSLKTLLTDAAGYNTSGTFKAGAGMSGTAAFLVRADVGTFTLEVVNDSGTVIDSITVDEEEWVLAIKHFTIATTDELIGFIFLGTDNADILYSQWNVIRMDYEGRFDLPSWVQQRQEVKEVGYYEPTVGASNNNTWYWDSCVFHRLEPRDYRVPVRYGDVISGRVILKDQYIRKAVQGKLLVALADVPYSRAYGHSGDIFSVYSDTTACPQDVLVAGWIKKLAANVKAFSDAKPMADREQAEEISPQEPQGDEPQQKTSTGWWKAL